MVNIYTFPPVGLVSVTLREDRPVRRASYALSGKRVVVSGGPTRREVQLGISALSIHRGGAGYMAELWRYIDGGINLVRLNVPPQNWHLDHLGIRAEAGDGAITWTDDGTVMPWSNDFVGLNWFLTGRAATVTTLAGYPYAVRVTGLPPSTLVARPGDILRVYGAGDAVGTAARVMDMTTSDASGVAIAPVASPLPAGIAAFGDEESIIFEVTDYSPQAQGVGQNWTVGMSLREVFASEIDSPVEIDPWRA